MPSTGFEDRNRHRPAYASLLRSINAYACSWGRGWSDWRGLGFRCSGTMAVYGAHRRVR